MKKYIKLALEYINDGNLNITEATKRACIDLGLEYTDDNRRRVSYYANKGKNIGISNASDSVNVDYKNVPYLWLKTKEASLFVRNPSFEAKEIDFDKIISECMSSFKPLKKAQKPSIKSCETFDRLVWTDAHVGMDASRGGLALYPVEWNASMLMDRIDKMANFVISKKSSNVLIIDELGDYMDGWDGETVRKGHKLHRT